jgi:hypothetical protein
MRRADWSITATMRCSWPTRAATASGRVPLPLLVGLAALLAVAPAGLAVTGRGKPRPRSAAPTLRTIASRADCALTEFDRDPRSNPPVSGRVDERIYAADGSYAGRRPPSTLASVHALLHGRVVFQYRRDVPAAEIAPLDRLVRATPSRTLLVANRTGMRARVAATAYLTLMTCPRVDDRTLVALRAFRDRRVGFGQAF